MQCMEMEKLFPVGLLLVGQSLLLFLNRESTHSHSLPEWK